MGDNARLLSGDHAAVELERLRAEVRRLRQALHVNGRHSRRLQRARDAAGLLSLWHAAYLDTSRAACMGRGLSFRAWEGAQALLRLARVIDARGRWLVHDPATAARALDHAHDRALAEPDAYFARGPRHMAG